MSQQSEPTFFLPMTTSMRLRLEATIENLIALLDEIDGDADVEPDVDDEDHGDDEPSLGALNDLSRQGLWGVDGYSYGDDRELEDEHDEAFGDVI